MNLLFNPSFDLDPDVDLLPDGWIREWGDLSCPYDMHLWDRVSPRRGACVRLYGVPPEGAAWRVSKAFAIPAAPGQRFRLQGRIRLQNATGESYLALRFQDADYNILREFRSDDLAGKTFWKSAVISATAPCGGVDVIAICGTKGNSGSVLFDDLELLLVDE